MPRKNTALKGELIFKKVSQGIARFQGQIDEVKGNFALELDQKVLGNYDPLVHNVTGTVELVINVKKK